MSLAILQTSALIGLESVPISVEVHVSTGLPQFGIVGLPNIGVRESRERVRAAIQNCGYSFPAGRITVNLAPADLPKESSSYDLAIALCILLASGQVGYSLELQKHPNQIFNIYFLGELSLTGTLTPSRGMLAQVLSIVQNKKNAIVVLPRTNAQELTIVPGVEIVGVKTLQEAVEFISQNIKRTLNPKPAEKTRASALYCMSEVKGQTRAKRAIEIAAAGRHNLLLSGSPGTGKTMLTTRIATITPELDQSSALQVAAIAELSSVAHDFGQPPFRQPHHSSSYSAIIGGGKKGQMGEISLAHHGILFLDELPEFNRTVLEALREPLESGVVHIARANYRMRLPADIQLIGAMNPCQCGWYGHPKKMCECNEERRKKYRMKVSGPLLDRFDMMVHVYSEGEYSPSLAPTESSAVILARVKQALDLQFQRQKTYNSRLSQEQIKTECKLSTEAVRVLQQVIEKYTWSARTVSNVMKVARTIADLAVSETIQNVHLIEAIQFKQDLHQT